MEVSCPRVTQPGRAGSKASPAPKPASFPLTHEGAELAGSSLVYGFILGPSLKATRFTWVNRKVDLKGLIISEDRTQNLPLSPVKCDTSPPFVFLAFGAVS